ncbi:MAG: hypothetical protein ABSA50_10040 [Candidatus Bathyarchaeia archaeon]|jgi:hypothetical protein
MAGYLILPCAPSYIFILHAANAVRDITLLSEEELEFSIGYSCTHHMQFFVFVPSAASTSARE